MNLRNLLNTPWVYMTGELRDTESLAGPFKGRWKYRLLSFILFQKFKHDNTNFLYIMNFFSVTKKIMKNTFILCDVWNVTVFAEFGHIFGPP
jgi:hypothetical protein